MVFGFMGAKIVQIEQNTKLITNYIWIILFCISLQIIWWFQKRALPL